MAIIKISELPAATSPVSASDVLPVVQNGTTKKAAINELGFALSDTGAITRTIQSKLSDVVSVKDFGAGNGDANDTPAIQAAIDALNTAGGGTLYFPPGVYNIQTQLEPRSNVSYKGEAGKSILKINATPGPTYTFNRTSLDIDNVTWDGLTFDGSLNYPANSQVYKQTYANMNSGIRIGGVKATNITVKNCQFLSLTLYSIDINAPYSENISILDNYFYRGSYRETVIKFRAQGITTEAERPSKILIQGNHIQQCGPQQFYDASKEDYVASADGIQLDKCRDSIIANNTVNQTASIGIRVEDSLRVTVVGNVVTEPGGDGIVVYKNAADVSVIGNTIKNWGRIPPAYCMRNYSGTYVLAREFPDPVAAPLPADPTGSSWFITWPYTTNGIDTGTILTYSDTNYYGTTTNGILPFRGNAAINIHTNTIRVTVSSNVAEGNVTQSGGLYNYAGDYGISAVPTVNDSAAGVVGNNMVNSLISGNLVADPRVYRIYHPQNTDPINARGPLQPATYIGNRDSSSLIWAGNPRLAQTGQLIASTGARSDFYANWINFPATQVTSSDVNTLDDYEEGTFNVTMTPSISGSVTLDFSTLAYTKVGRVVTVTGEIRVSSVNSPVGDITVGNLPFANSGLSGRASRLAFYVEAYTLSGTPSGVAAGFIDANSSEIALRLVNNFSFSSLASNLQANSTFLFNFSYMTAT